MCDSPRPVSAPRRRKIGVPARRVGFRLYGRRCKNATQQQKCNKRIQNGFSRSSGLHSASNACLYLSSGLTGQQLQSGESCGFFQSTGITYNKTQSSGLIKRPPGLKRGAGPTLWPVYEIPPSVVSHVLKNY